MTRLLAFLGRFVVTSLAVGAAIGVGYRLWAYYMDEPWTRDGHVRAEVVQVAPDVSGFVSEVLVKDNQPVRRGDVIFRIDRARFVLALQQADATLAGRRAALVQANADLKRYSALDPGLVVSQQRLEQVVSTQQQAQAAYDQAVVDRAQAQLNLERTEVRASVNGTISNMELLPGNYITTGKGVMALVDSDTLHVDGYFEETKLSRIHVGDLVRVQLMGSPQVLRGRVESIAAGIEDRDRGQGASLLANVNPTFNWVRLAQRVPVRITLERTPAAGALVAGRTATVEVLGARTTDVATADAVTAQVAAVGREVKTTLAALLSDKAQPADMVHRAHQPEGTRQVAQTDHDRQLDASVKPIAQPRAGRTGGRDQRHVASRNPPSSR
jgi:multidrug resistance efflux pump